MTDLATAPVKKPSNGAPAIAAPATPPASTRYAVIPLDQVEESEENERKTYDETEMAELAASIGVDGVKVPVKVQPGRPGSKLLYELVYGNRRLRASKRAKRTDIPALIVDRRLTPKEIRREQFIENRGRADLHPIEDAEAMKAMIDNDGETALSLAKLRQKSESWVYGRLKLCELPAAVKKLCMDGKLPATHALLVARIPSAKLQAEAAAEMLNDEEWDQSAGDRVKSVMTYRKAVAHVQKKYMLQLAEAPFDTKDAELVPAAGACSACPKRSGNQPELFADVKAKDTCTDPVCFDGKRAADWDKKAAEALRGGFKVMSDSVAKKVFSSGSTHISYNADFVDPHSSESVPYDVAQGKKTWAQLLGRDLPPKLLARDGTGAARQLVAKDAAQKALGKLGLMKKPKAPASSVGSGATSGSKEWKEQRKAAAEKAAIREATTRIALGKIGKAANAAGADGTKLWRYVARELVRGFPGDLARHAERRGITKNFEKDLLAWIEKYQGNDARGLAVELLAVGEHNFKNVEQPMKDAAELLGVDLKACEAEAKKEQQAKVAAPAPAKKPAGKGKAKK